MSAPPRLARRLLEALLPPGTVRDGLVGDLDELYAERAARGRLRADAWYLRQVAVAAARYLPRRMGGGAGGADGLAGEVRTAARSLLRAPGFTVTVVAVLALGIGGTTAVYSVVRSVLLEPLPYDEPGSLVRVYQREVDEPSGDQYVSGAHFLEYRESLGAFEELAALYTYRETGADLTLDGAPRRVRTLLVSSGYFSVLRAEPVLGRGLRRDEERDARLVVLSHELWRALGADPRIVGRSVDLDGASHVVLGVAPAGLRDPVAGEIDAWLPVDLSEESGSLHPDNHFLTVVGRLAPGATVEAAGDELAGLDRALLERWSEADDVGWMVPLHDDVVGDARPLLGLLLGAVGLVLLLACVNVAGLLMVRTTTRGRELAVRAALGAGRLRIARQLLVESLLLALAGGALGVALAPLVLRVLLGAGSDAIPRAAEVGLDASVLLFAAALAFGTGLAFGTLPALRAGRGTAPGALGDGARGGSAGRSPVRMRSALVAVQVALALVLLSGATVLATSLYRLQGVDLGVRTDDVLTFELNLPAGRYDAAARDRLHADLARRLAAVPGIEAVGATSRLPALGNYHNWGTRPLTGPFAGEERYRGGQQRVVSGDLFAALEIDLLEGRVFDARDDAEAPGRAVVSRTMAEALFGDAPAVGQRLRAGGQDREVIGVVEDVSVTAEGRPGQHVYHAHAQFADNRNWNMTYVVASAVPPESILPAVRREVAALDAELVVHRPATLAEVLGRGRSPRSFAFALTAAFAALALTLALLGLYGVVSYAVRQRTREIGIRMALGADAGGVRAMVLRQALAVVAVGLALGLVGSRVLGRFLTALLFETEPGDPALLGAAAASLLAGAVAAVWMPARRATRVAPRVALEGE